MSVFAVMLLSCVRFMTSWTMMAFSCSKSRVSDKTGNSKTSFGTLLEEIPLKGSH